MTDVFLVSAARTPIGSFGGSLKTEKPGELAAHVIKAALDRASLDPAHVGNVVLGNVIHTEPRDAYAARIAAIGAGIPQETPAHSVNRLCGSGLQAIIEAAQSIKLGDCDVAVGAGAEIMSQAPYFATGVRWGQKMGASTLLDGLTGALTDPFHAYHMGVTAENVAQRYGISREEQDALALASHQRAAGAIAQGYFREQIAPVERMVKGKTAVFDTDEFVRTDASAADFAKLSPVFLKQDGTVTAGNASGINDGAAAVLLASERAIKAHGLNPIARLISYGHAGVDPAYMGIGPVPATSKALAKAGLAIGDIDVIEANEAFAAQACAVSKELALDPERVNPNGSGISLGHPVGATGAIIVTKLAYELLRTGSRYGLTTMCIGGGQGIAAIWERV
ncbi:acetyl-CoA C-acyltransferase [Nostoc sp. 3335mG]|nr:acetyl-CoA C-acyltransferase [Nostoc sp. 3335mG]